MRVLRWQGKGGGSRWDDCQTMRCGAGSMIQKISRARQIARLILTSASLWEPLILRDQPLSRIQVNSRSERRIAAAS